MERPVAVITGGSRGIGAATALALGDTHRVELLGRGADALRSVAEQLPDAGVHQGDLTDPGVVAALAARLPRVDVLVHAAGTVEIASLRDSDPDVWERTMRINVLAAVELTRALLPALTAQQADVVFLNSGQGRTPTPNWGAYAASKFALRGYAEVLRAEEPELRVTTVYPGRTATEMQQGVRSAEGGAYEEDRYLRPESVADAVVAAITASPDAQVPEVVVRPATR